MCTRCRFRKRFLLFGNPLGSWDNTKRMRKRYRMHVGLEEILENTFPLVIGQLCKDFTHVTCPG